MHQRPLSFPAMLVRRDRRCLRIGLSQNEDNQERRRRRYGHRHEQIIVGHQKRIHLDPVAELHHGRALGVGDARRLQSRRRLAEPCLDLRARDAHSRRKFLLVEPIIVQH